MRNQPDGRELTMARWGMPSPVFALKGKKSIWASPMSARGPNPRTGGAGWGSRAGVSYPSRFWRTRSPDGTHPPVWFALMDPAARFLCGHLDALYFRSEDKGRRDDQRHFRVSRTRTRNKVVGAIHPKAMPVILTGTQGNRHLDDGATRGKALKLQRPLPDDAFGPSSHVGEKKDEGGLVA